MAESGITNIHTAPLREESTRRGTWRYLDLSGDHLGVRIEELAPGETSSEYHYHTLEEEHVIVMSGQATLRRGDERMPLTSGDHVLFLAGDERAHHIINEADEPLRLLVFGERNAGDVVIYPEHKALLVKSPEVRQYRYVDPSED